MKSTLADPLTPKLRRRLDEAAKKIGMPATRIVRKALETHLADIEDDNADAVIWRQRRK